MGALSTGAKSLECCDDRDGGGRNHQHHQHLQQQQPIHVPQLNIQDLDINNNSHIFFNPHEQYLALHTVIDEYDLLNNNNNHTVAHNYNNLYTVPYTFNTLTKTTTPSTTTTIFTADLTTRLNINNNKQVLNKVSELNDNINKVNTSPNKVQVLKDIEKKPKPKANRFKSGGASGGSGGGGKRGGPGEDKNMMRRPKRSGKSNAQK